MSTLNTPAVSSIQAPLTQPNSLSQLSRSNSLNDFLSLLPSHGDQTIDAIRNLNLETPNQQSLSNSILHPTLPHTSINIDIQNIAQPVLNTNIQTPIRTPLTEQITVESLDRERLAQRDSSRQNARLQRLNEISDNDLNESDEEEIIHARLPVPPPLVNIFSASDD